MKERKQLLNALANDSLDTRVAEIYGCTVRDALEYKGRLSAVVKQWEAHFKDNLSTGLGLYTAPGRTEIGGNHTDHQWGCVLAASVNLDTIAAAAPNGTPIIHFYSEGYGTIRVDTRELYPNPEEKETTASLIRGMAAQAKEKGCKVSGFDAYCISSVFGGSGLSSSAAFETLVGVILNDLFGDNRLSAVTIARMGQKAENDFFGKPSGLMDQMASSVGGIVAIDFEDPRDPKVDKLEIDFTKSGYALCIIDSQSSHADLTGAYAGIPTEMNAVAGVFDREHLRQMTMDELIHKTGEVRRHCGDRAFLRAVHFLLENRRAQDEARALDNGDFDRFLTLVSESGRSSAMYLQNTVVAGQVKDQAVNVVLALCDVLLAGKGAFRVHGGGFAGTVQAFVPLSELEAFKRQMEGAVGPGCCHVLTIRPVGGAVI